MKGCVGLRLPLWSNAAASLGFMVSYFHYMPRRCEVECAVPGQGDVYQGLLGTLKGAHRASWYASGPPSGSCVYTCAAVNGWLMLYVGFLVPIWVLGLMEWQAWRRWQRRPGLTAGRRCTRVAWRWRPLHASSWLSRAPASGLTTELFSLFIPNFCRCFCLSLRSGPLVIP